MSPRGLLDEIIISVLLSLQKTRKTADSYLYREGIYDNPLLTEEEAHQIVGLVEEKLKKRYKELQDEYQRINQALEKVTRIKNHPEDWMFFTNDPVQPWISWGKRRNRDIENT